MNFNLNFFRLPSISYAVTACNEVKELKVLLDILLKNKGNNDEIIVLLDISHANPEMHRLLASYPSIVKIESTLNGDFATFKNKLLATASKDYLFQIDADEFPRDELFKKLKWFLFKNYKADCFLVPRINIVDDITDKDMQTWGWNKNADGYINFPDFQTRIMKNNGKIYWVNKVHEVLTNYKKQKTLPIKNYDFCLVHPKNIKKQRLQNDFYDTL